MLTIQKIRNINGKLLCVIHYDKDGSWQVVIRDHKTDTIMTLMPGGSIGVINENISK